MNVEVDNDPGDTIVVEDEKLPLLEFGSWNTTPSQLQKRNKEMMVQKWHMSHQLQRMSPKKAAYTRRNVKNTERVKLLCKTQQLVECSMDTPALPWINETETMQETVQKPHENLYQLVGNSELIIVKPDDNITELGRDNAEPQIKFCEKTTAVNELQEIEQRADMNLQRLGEDSEKVIQMDERLHENPHQDIEDSEQSITIKPENNNAEMAENLQENLKQQKEGSEEAKTAKPLSDDIVGVQEMALKLQENFKEASLARPQNDKREKLQEMSQRLQEKAEAVHAILSGELIDGSHDTVSMAMEMEFVRLQGDELIRILQDVVEMLGQYNRLIKEEDCSASNSKT
ncbi:hypothetical protein QJS10_CPB18g00034 [Acorus calamus]|uniref:Uncharacterized protein n=1 Tax=Acorus calamus TaxID=4465 RepID=A0AAV9CLI2_ACOCL|nr:hypothetical protein QJS10_CPB18g00034 [Acorus calamus]